MLAYPTGSFFFSKYWIYEFKVMNMSGLKWFNRKDNKKTVPSPTLFWVCCFFCFCLFWPQLWGLQDLTWNSEKCWVLTIAPGNFHPVLFLRSNASSQFSCLLQTLLVSFFLSTKILLSNYYQFYFWRRAWQPTPIFCLENPPDRRAWQSGVNGVAKSQTRLSN